VSAHHPSRPASQLRVISVVVAVVGHGWLEGMSPEGQETGKAVFTLLELWINRIIGHPE
jgi:hypothetical protein